MLSCLKFFISVLVLFSIFPTLPVFAQSQPFQSNPDSIPFAPAVNYGAGDGPYSVFCADLDRDSDLDLAVANAVSNNVSILKNNGDGTFQSATNYETGGVLPVSVFCADLDGDADLDLAVSNSNYYSRNVSILKNNGDGTFAAAVNYLVWYDAYTVFCADLDGDGDLDLAVGNNNYYGYVNILKNNGDATFQPAVYYVAGYDPQSVFCADLDGDADLDLAVANHSSNNVSILKNNGDGTFAAAVNYWVENFPKSVFCADLDADGDLDLAMANDWWSGGNKISILKNNGNGTFDSLVHYSVGDFPKSVFCADLDGDGDLDLAVPINQGNYISILKNNGDGTFQSAVNYGAGGDEPVSVFCADLDADSDMDLAVANGVSDSVSILLNLSNYARPNSFPLISPPNEDCIRTTQSLNWQKAIDPDPDDTVWYDLYLSRDSVFSSDSVVYDSLLDTTFVASVDTGLWYWNVKAYDKWGAERWSDQTWSFYVFLLGDVNGDGKIDLADVITLANYVLKGWPVPSSCFLKAADVDCDGKYDLADVIRIARYVLFGELFPC